jgi:fibronectin-binding autotransporter adhesin
MVIARLMRALRRRSAPALQRLFNLRLMGLLTVFVFVLTLTSGVFYTRAGAPTRVYAATSSTLNFQGRLLTSSGSTVTDTATGQIRFKIYDGGTAGASAGTGQANSGTGGTYLWSEVQTNIRVVNGYFSVNLGSQTAFPGTIDWSQELWLTMDVYNGASFDGEMTNANVRMKLTAVPYAFRAGQADSLTDGSGTVTASNLLQKAPLTIQSVNANIAGLRFNQVGSGGLIQIQADGGDIFTVGKTGNLFLAGTIDIDGATLDIGTGSLTGSLVLNDGSSNTGAISVAALSGNRTYTFPDADGTICLTTTCAGAASTLQQVYGNDTDGSDTVLGLTTADDSLILRNPSTNGTDSGFAMRIEQLNTGSVAGLEISQAGSGFAFRVNDDGTNTDSSPFVIDQNGNVAIGNTSASELFTVGATEQFKVTNTGAVTAVGITSSAGLSITSGGASIQGGINNNSGGITGAGSITGVGTNITATAGLTIASGGSGALNLTSASGTIEFGSSILQRSGAALTLDVLNTGSSTLYITNSDGSNLANLNVEGSLTSGVNGAFTVNSSGDITSVFAQLDGSSTANGANSGSTSTSLVLNDATSFDVGNYVQVSSTSCGGTGVNVCYAKITAKATNTLTITPALKWANASNVTEYHVPEIGGTDTSQSLANRYGRGYFIAGVATGNGTTFYNEDSITTSLTSFDLFNSGLTSLNIGGAATSVNIGNSSGTVTIAGNVVVNGSISGTAPTSGTSGYFSRSGTTLSTATAGDSLSITGTLSGLTGLTVASGGASVSGGLNNNSGGITNAGSITGVGTNITATAGLTIASAGSGNLTLTSASGTLILNGSIWQRVASGSTTIDLADSGTTQLQLSNSGSGVASLNLNDGELLVGGTSILTNARALQNLTGVTVASGGIAVTGNSTITGTLSGLTGLTIASGGTSISGGLNNNSGGITNAGSITGVGTNITATAGLTIASGGSGDLTLDSATNVLVLLDATIQRVASGTTTIDLRDAANTRLDLNNSLAGALSLNLSDGELLTAGTSRLTNGGALQNITGLSSSGTITLSSLNTGGLIKSNTSGVLSIATGGTDYELPLTFGNGLTRLSNAITFGGALTANTDVPLSGFNLALSGSSGNLLLGTTTASGRFTIADSSTSSTIFANKTGASGNILTLQKDGNGVFTIFNGGATQISTTSTAALVVQNADGSTTQFSVNTSGNIVQIGSTDSNTTGVLLVLDSMTGSDPSGVNGASYYNLTDGKFRCFEAGQWYDCASTRVVGETTLGAAGSTINVNLSVPVEYLRCRLDLKGRSALATVYMRFNNDAGAASYAWNEYDIQTTTVGDAQDSSDSELQLNGTDTGTSPGSADIQITNFADTRKVVTWTWAAADAPGTNSRRYSGGGTWGNAANAISSVQFITSTGNFLTGSHAWCEGRNVR